jgi:hypothetical protein
MSIKERVLAMGLILLSAALLSACTKSSYTEYLSDKVIAAENGREQEEL